MNERIGVLTGGGDCPGLNPAIRAVVRRGLDTHDLGMVGFRNGWRGVLEGDAEPLTLDSTRGILHRGGTILGTSRTDPVAAEDGPVRIAETLRTHRLDGLVVLGGEGTLSAADKLNTEHGVPAIGVPKTIDNDLGATDFTIGFSTALEIATEAVDRLHSTAESHNHVMLLEVMGRNAGWIATYAGIAGGADAILIPEQPFDIDQICSNIEHRHGMGREFSIVVVAEGAVPAEGTLELADYDLDEFGRARLGGLAAELGPVIEAHTGFSTRVTALGHVQRGGSPNAFDRVLASTAGVAAADAAVAGKWGRMTALCGNEIDIVPLSDAVAQLKRVPTATYQVAEIFFG